MRFPSCLGTRGSREPGPCWPAMMSRRVHKGVTAGSTRYRERARSVIRGRRSTGVATDSATDAQEIDMSTDDEQRVRNSHYNRITCNGPGCPGHVRHVDSVDAHSGRHTAANRAARQAIPGAVSARQRLALADPAERRLGVGRNRFRRRLVLAVAPGAAWAVLVMVLTARHADHGPYSGA
jgi:hypothetical protein